MKTTEELLNSKIWLKGCTEDVVKRIQLRLFQLGFSWPDKSVVAQYLDCDAVYLSASKVLTIYNSIGYFDDHKNKQIWISDLGLDCDGYPFPKFNVGDHVRFFKSDAYQPKWLRDLVGCTFTISEVIYLDNGVTTYLNPSITASFEDWMLELVANVELEVGDIVNFDCKKYVCLNLVFSQDAMVHGHIKGAENKGKILAIKNDRYLISVFKSTATEEHVNKPNCINGCCALEYIKKDLTLHSKGDRCQPIKNDNNNIKSINNENKSNQHGQHPASSIVKVNQLVSRIRSTEKPRGNQIAGRSSKSTITSRYIGYTTSIIRS